MSGKLLAFLLAGGFLGLMFGLWQMGHMPLWVPLGHLAMSLIAFTAYSIDKARARDNGWRISEKTLHLLEFFGGWPVRWSPSNCSVTKTAKPNTR